MKNIKSIIATSITILALQTATASASDFDLKAEKSAKNETKSSLCQTQLSCTIEKLFGKKQISSMGPGVGGDPTN